MGISLESFRIFGGLLLFLIALEMVFARESGTRISSGERAESVRRADISVFPLAFPFIAGPGALATILLWFGPVRIGEQPLLFLGLLVGVGVVLVLSLGAMWLAAPLMRVLGVTGANVANRLLGVVLGALAVQFVHRGLRAVLELDPRGTRGPIPRVRGVRRASRSASAMRSGGPLDEVRHAARGSRAARRRSIVSSMCCA